MNSQKQQRKGNRQRRISICETTPPPEKVHFWKRLIDFILSHFNYTFNAQLSDKTKQRVKTNYQYFFAYYAIDFFICNFIIAPAVISVWRGVWDYSLIYLEDLLGEVYIQYIIHNLQSTAHLTEEVVFI